MTQPAPAPSAPTPPSPPPPPSDEVTLTINDRQVTTRKGTLLVEAARQAGIEIPVFCYHPKLKSVGACRMCLVEIEKMRGLQTACTTVVAADMIVRTTSPDAMLAQNGVIEFLLENHPLDCPICDKGGECPLQNNTFKYGRGTSRFTEQKRHLEKAYPLSDRIVLDRERCIMCYRCVRFHQEIPGDEALAAIHRGTESMIGTLPGETYDSIFSGNTIELCPVGALTSRQYRFRARPWDLVHTPSVCNGCAVGCNLDVDSRAENVLRLMIRENPDVDGGWLCDSGRFGTLPVAADLRPARPLLRDAASGELRPATWAEALKAAAGLLNAPDAATLVSPALSNEALWLAQQHLPSGRAAVWPPLGGHWPVQGAITNLLQCSTILLVGLDVWLQLPVLALWIRRAVSRGARLIVVNAANGLFRDTTQWVQAAPGAEIQAALDLALTGEGPAAVLAHPALLVGNPSALASLEQLAQRIGADGQSGLVGAPALAANGRGAQDLAPDLAQADPLHLAASASRLLLLGDEPWDNLPAASLNPDLRLVLATDRPLTPNPRIAVVLPMSHPYERQGSLTNLEGRVQLQEGGAVPLPHVRADWDIVAGLARAMGTDRDLPGDLTAIRAAIRAVRPDWPLEEPMDLVARV